MNTGDVNVGTILRYNGELCQVIEWQHRTPGNLRAFYQGKMRNLINGKLVENRFRAGEEVEIARVEYRELQYLYRDANFLVCMDNETFEQFPVNEDLFGNKVDFVSEGAIVKVAFEGDNIIIAEPPTFIESEITYTEPGVKGDTATNTLKQATIATGAVINVPLFVNQGERVKVDTRTGTYVERVK